ncbi:MAG: hypothetical protein KF811_10880 [Dokdonella sp.]|nr:hypothetical protein [Dokdonella sp.]
MALAGAPKNADLGQFAWLTSIAFAGFGSQAISDQIMGVPGRALAQSRWLLALVDRRGKNKATVALANKMVRIVWAVLAGGTTYDPRKAFRPQPAR